MHNLTEANLEAFIADHLVTHGGYQRVTIGRGDFDPALGLDLVELLAFLAATQPDECAQLARLHGGADQALEKFGTRVARELDQRGTVDVLRHGVVDLGVHVRLAYFRPAHGLTATLRQRYDANLLAVARQLPYEQGTRRTLDICLLVNGIPVATAELKNALTGQGLQDAIDQYRRDRDPLNVTLSRRAVVHFALDTEAVAMTTRLAGGDTVFLPFNRGDGGGAGNPPNPDGHRTAYLWKRVWQRDAWLDLLHRFVHVVEPAAGSRSPRTTIFPRYHQWDAVRALEAATRDEGAGGHYLVQHSAGSGKSNTIAWLAHRLSTLHDADDRRVFDKVVVITDRRVLDRQLQETIFQFEHTHGVVERIDADSAQLAAALQGETARIIITTLQKFPYVLRKGIDLPGRRYAIVIDEAHSSQSGEAANDLRQLLGDAARTLEGYDDDAAGQALAAAQAARGRQANLSVYAFTATPKGKTLEVFGRWSPASSAYLPFHLYPMRQAIEEGFILDVLASYTTYASYWNVAKHVPDDPAYDSSKALRAVKRFVSLHHTNLAQKAEIIVEHFREHVAHKIGGCAKAMVVTGSRQHAVRYTQALRNYIAQHGYVDMGVLAAFSGSVTDAGMEHTEARLNGAPDSQTAELFGQPGQCFLVVAEKFQTGFDQPLLYAMYVDKPLSSVAAVQTLSRLNRIADGKDGTFVLDFHNSADDMRAAFAPYYDRTVATATDPNMMFDARRRLLRFDVLRETEMDAIVAELLTGAGADPQATARVAAALGPTVQRFDAMGATDQAAVRDALKDFLRLYGFLSQVLPISDPAVERDYHCARALAALIRRPTGDSIDLGTQVELTHLRLEQTSHGEIALDPGDGRVTSLAGSDGPMEQMPFDQELLSQIVVRVNEQFGAGLKPGDELVIEQSLGDIARAPDTRLRAGANTLEDFARGFDELLKRQLVARMGDNEEVAIRMLNNDDARQAYLDARLPALYAQARVARQHVCPIGDLIGPDREDALLEYKSTLRWDVRAGAKGPIPEGAVVKTIAGFLNASHGGTLLIGIADDGSTYGLEADYATFSKRGQRGDRDLWGQHLENLLIQRLGSAATSCVSWDFHHRDGDDVCRVKVEASSVPVFVAKGEERAFWWRFATGTRRVDDADQRDQIIARRWPQTRGAR